MTDLPANVTFPANADGWQLDQGDDAVTSVQAFLAGPELIIELCGTCTVKTPTGKRYEGYEFQQNSWIDVRSLAWRAKRWVYNIHDRSHLVENAVIFELAGGADEIADVRRF